MDRVVSEPANEDGHRAAGQSGRDQPGLTQSAGDRPPRGYPRNQESEASAPPNAAPTQLMRDSVNSSATATTTPATASASRSSQLPAAFASATHTGSDSARTLPREMGSLNDPIGRFSVP